MRRLLVIGAAVAAGVAVAAIVASTVSSSRKSREEPADGEGGGSEYRVDVTPEMKRHTKIRNAIYFAGTVWLWGALWLVLKSGWSRRLQRIAERRTDRFFIRDMLWFTLFLATMGFLLFPLDYYAGFLIPHRFDLSNQSLAQWLVESFKAFGVATVVGSPIAAAAMLLIRTKRDRWWVWLWAGTIPLTLASVLLSPLVIEPLFNEFRPLENRGLEKRLLTLASLAGIERSTVFQVDKSRQTKTMNAYVTGLGLSKRIVIWDTLLNAMSDDEVVFVTAHEIGHYVRHDIWKGIGFGTSILLGVFWLGSKIAERGFERFGESWEMDDPSDPAVIPWYLFVLTTTTFFLSPVFAGYSRGIEHAADVFALEYTGLNEAGAGAFIKLAEGSKIDPDPHPLMKFWRYSHPPLSERIDFVLRYGR